MYEPTAGRDGAPKLNIRCDPTIYARIKSVPEGARDYVERLVWDDMQRIEEARARAATAREERKKSKDLAAAQRALSLPPGVA